jgi:non-heme chloroperoxidase
MGFATGSDGAQIFYKDWGSGLPVAFSHGWPLTVDSWEAQMLFLVSRQSRREQSDGGHR